MNSLTRLLSFSDCIYKLTRNLENKTCLELLNDMLKEEEDYLNSIHEVEFQKLVEEIKKKFDVTGNETVYELFYKKKLAKNEIRVYALVKEKINQKEITSIKEEELELLLLKKNPLACKINRLKDAIKRLDVSLLDIVPLEQKEEMSYYFTSFSTPNPTYDNLRLKSKQEYFIENIKETIQKNILSLLTYLMVGNKNKIKQQFCKIIEGYTAKIDENLKEEFTLVWKENLIALKETKKIAEIELEKVMDYLEDLTFKKTEEKKKDLGIEALEIKDFSQEEMIYYENLFQELFAICGAELKLFMEVKNSKLNFENKSSREEIYIKIAKLIKLRKDIFKKKIDGKKLKTYIKITNDCEKMNAPYDWIDAPKNETLMKKIIINRLLESIPLIEEKQEEMINGNIVLVSDSKNLKYYLASPDIINEEKEVLNGINYCIDLQFYNFLGEYLMNYGLEEDLITSLFLILYHDPSITEKLIKKDFEYNLDKNFVMTYQTFEKYKEKIFEEIENNYQKCQERNDEFSKFVFINYIYNMDAILPKEDYEKIKKIYEEKMRKYSRNLKK